VQIQTHVQNDGSSSASTTVKSYLVDASGTLLTTLQSTQTIAAGSAGTFVQTTTVSNPHLWSPNTPYLYTVYSEVDNGTTAVDGTSTRVGIRSINFSKAKGFTLNGQHFVLNGTNRGHQEYPYIGFAVPTSGQYRDALILKEGGANFVRSAHYPPHPAFLDACDELGIMVMDSIPGWQYYNTATQFVNDSYNDVRSMIRRDRNHPAVILWEVSLNETTVPDSYAQMTHSITHAEYPGSQAFSYGGNTTDAGSIFDVQNAGYSTTGPAALLIREYGDWEYGGNQSTSRSIRSDGEAAMLLSASNKQQSLNSYLTPNSSYVLAGQATWSGFDYNRGYNPTIAYCGLVDLFRIPKFVYYFFQSQRDPSVTLAGVNSGPMVYIASWWSSTSPKSVTVYSNCSQVKLYLNNTLIATQSPDTGSNDTYLYHAPFTFNNLTWASGTLRADGLINNAVVASYSTSTPGTATHIVVTIDTANQSLVADGTDLAIVQAKVVDQNGTIVPTNTTSISFSVSGAGSLVGGNASIGANPVTTGAGISAALVVTTQQAGQITVTASASGLQAGSAAVTSVASTVATVPLPTSGVTPTPTPTSTPTPTPTPVGTTYYQLVNRNSGKALDVNGASTTAGAITVQETISSGYDEQWSLMATGSYYYIVNRNSGLVLDVNGASKTAGASVIQWTNNGGTNQQWSLTATGSYYYIVNRNSGMVLDVNGASTANGGTVIQWTNNGGTNQQWSLVQV
jgi:beta-galactosidase